MEKGQVHLKVAVQQNSRPFESCHSLKERHFECSCHQTSTRSICEACLYAHGTRLWLSLAKSLASRTRCSYALRLPLILSSLSRFFFLLKVCQWIPLYAENVYDQQLMGFKRSHLKIQDPFELNQNSLCLLSVLYADKHLKHRAFFGYKTKVVRGPFYHPLKLCFLYLCSIEHHSKTDRSDN